MLRRGIHFTVSFLPHLSRYYGSSCISQDIRSCSTPSQSHFTKYGGRILVTLIPGDGIGKELCNSVKGIFSAMNVPIDFEEVHMSGYDAADANSKALQNAIQSLKRTKIGLKGILFTPIDGHSSYNLALRKDLDIFANIIPIKILPGVPSRFAEVDLVIIRENTEGEYSGLEHQPVPGVIESMKITTKEKSERIIRYAFDYALKHGRKRVTCVHKANIMKLTDGLFLKTFTEVAETYKGTGILADSMIVDNTAMQLVSNPKQFDVMVMPNLYGNICTNIGAGLIGGPGLVPGCNMGRDIGLFEPGARHVAMDIKDRNYANPTSMILSASWMLQHVGLNEESERLAKAVKTVLANGKHLTRDLKGTCSTTDFCSAVTANLE